MKYVHLDETTIITVDGVVYTANKDPFGTTYYCFRTSSPAHLQPVVKRLVEIILDITEDKDGPTLPERNT
jgi:hypothetical protein